MANCCTRHKSVKETKPQAGYSPLYHRRTHRGRATNFLPYGSKQLKQKFSRCSRRQRQLAHCTERLRHRSSLKVHPKQRMPMRRRRELGSEERDAWCVCRVVRGAAELLGFGGGAEPLYISPEVRTMAPLFQDASSNRLVRSTEHGAHHGLASWEWLQ